MSIKCGAAVEVRGYDMTGAPVWHAAKVIRQTKGRELADEGHLTGIVFGASFKGNKFYCDAAGSLHRNPVVGLGVVGMLHGELEHRIRLSAPDTTI